MLRIVILFVLLSVNFSSFALGLCFVGRDCLLQGIKGYASTTNFEFDLTLPNSEGQRETAFRYSSNPKLSTPITLAFRPTYYWGWLEGQFYFESLTIQEPTEIDGDWTYGFLPSQGNVNYSSSTMEMNSFTDLQIGYGFSFEGWKILPLVWFFTDRYNNTMRFFDVSLGIGLGYRKMAGRILLYEDYLNTSSPTYIQHFNEEKYYFFMPISLTSANLTYPWFQLRMFTYRFGSSSVEFEEVNPLDMELSLLLMTIEYVSFSWFF